MEGRTAQGLRGGADDAATAAPGLDLVRSVALVANTAEDPGEAFDVAIELVCRSVGWPIGVVWWVTRTDRSVRLLPASVHVDPSGRHEELARVLTAEAAPEEVLRALLRQGAPASVWHLEGDGPHTAAARAAGVDVSVAFPVPLGEEVVAVLQFFAETEHAPGPAVTHALETVAIQLARVVERSRTQAELDTVRAEVARLRAATEGATASDDDRLVAGLRDAIGRDQLDLLYQPIIELASGRMASVEALVRWRHPDRGTVAPSDFIPAAERHGLIGEVGAWVLRRACADLGRWRARGHAHGLRVAVNVSAVQLEDPGLLDTLDAALEDHRIPPGCVTLEVTETFLGAEGSSALQRLWDARGRGVQLAVDDFGTGYSSLARLRAFPFDVLKIDRGFIIDSTRRGRDEDLLHGIARIAQRMDVAVVAEGVETPAQLQVAIEAGATYAQGYLFSVPLSADRVQRLLDDPTWDTHDDG